MSSGCLDVRPDDLDAHQQTFFPSPTRRASDPRRGPQNSHPLSDLQAKRFSLPR